MTFAQLIQYIAAWIYTNHNNEITASILKDVLDKIAEYSRDNYDELELVDQDLQDQINNININVGLTVHTGSSNPNILPPTDPYSAPDFYLQNNGTIWVFDGTFWINISDNLVNSRITEFKIDAGDLSSIDASGVVDYFNNLSPFVMKNANDDWIISVIDGGGNASLRFILVDIGKGYIGDGEGQIAVDNLIPMGEGSGGSGGSVNTKIHALSLSGIDPDLPELTKIAEAVKLHGPFTCDAGQQMVFKTISTVGTQENGSIVTRYYRLIRNMVSIGGPSSVEDIPVSWFMPDGVSEYSDPETDGTIAELGDIGTQNVWDVFNLGNNGEAWDMSEYRFVRATQN